VKKGIEKRVARITAKGEATGKEAKQLARKRAETYKAKGGTPKPSGTSKPVSGTKVGNKPKDSKVGPGKKNTLKRELYKAGGSKKDLKTLQAELKPTRKTIKKSSQSMDNYDIKGTVANLRRYHKAKVASESEAKPTPAKPSIARAMYEMKKAAGVKD